MVVMVVGVVALMVTMKRTSQDVDLSLTTFHYHMHSIVPTRHRERLRMVKQVVHPIVIHTSMEEVAI